MTKKKKVAIGLSAGVAIVVILALLLVFVFDVFGLYTSSYRLNYDKYVKVGKYKGLQYNKVSVNVSDKEVKSEIKTRVSEHSVTNEVKKGTVKKGDTINVSYVGKINGKTFSGGSAENSTITVGETQMIDGFVDGLIGKKVGSSVKLNLKFPKNYSVNEKLSGKKVVFNVKIKSKQVTTTPKYDLAFVKKYTKFKSVAEYEKSIKAELLKNKKEQAENNVKDSLWNQVLATASVKTYPKKQLEYEQNRVINQYKTTAKSYNMEWKDFVKQYMQMSEKDFNKQAKEYAKTVVKQKLVMHSLAKTEGLKVSKSEYNEYLDKLLKDAGFTKDTFKNQYNQSIEKYAEENDFKTNLLLQKVLDKVMEYGKAK